jgi:hypothetical protein
MLPPPLADSAAEIPIPHFQRYSALVLCDGDDVRFVFCALCFLIFPPFPIPVSPLDLPCRRVALADALLGMVNTDLLLLLLLFLLLSDIMAHWEPSQS